MADVEQTKAVLVEDQLRDAYLDYSMSVIVGRALPDVRDGLKPVHRRILFSMYDMGLAHNKPFVKCARIVGECFKYHPHGDAAIYDSLVRMVQTFSLRYPLIAGHGNFGCFTGDTRIKLLDGASKSFRELCELYKNNEVFYVYSVNKEGNIVVGEAKNPRVTKKNAELVEVTLDTGEKIRCTPNHKFLLKDRSYKEARDLTSKDSLMRGDLKGIGEAIYLAKAYNHNAVSVRFLEDSEDVYDITVDVHHNFLLDCGVFVHNSIDYTESAQMRYVEAKLAKLSEELLADIEKDTVDFVPNFDGSLKEPQILPGKVPNLLINGSSGIAVGMATNIPPHNLREVCDAITHLIDHPEADLSELLQFITGPDFPTGGIICGRSGILSAYKTGKGKLRVRGRTHIEENGGREAIIITEIPYMVNKTLLIEEMATLVNEKVIDGVADIRDESDREGMRIMVSLKRSEDANVVLNQLYRHTALESTFGVILLALDGTQPLIMTLRDILGHYITHRRNVLRRRTQFDLRKAEEREHILQGLQIALNDIDPIVKGIKASKTVEVAKSFLMEGYQLSDRQALAILDMRLQRLTSLETEKIREESKGLQKVIEDLKAILASEQKILDLIRKDLLELKQEYGDARRTEITDIEEELEDEDLIPDEEVAVLMTRSGYIKRMPVEQYHLQHRGGIGVKGTEKKEEDIVETILITTTHQYLLCFSSSGQVYWLKVYKIPEVGKYAKGKAIVNLLQLKPQDSITTVIPIRQFDDKHYLIMCTKKGKLKKTELRDYSRPRSGGIVGIKLLPGDELVTVKLTPGTLKFIIGTKKGNGVRFDEEDVRDMGRNATGVRGVRLEEGDEVIGMEVAIDRGQLLTVTENGFGKRTSILDYRLISRGGKGVMMIKTSERNGNVVAIKTVKDDDEVMIATINGNIIRVLVKDIPNIGRNTQGVRVIRLREGDKVSTVERVKHTNNNPQEQSTDVNLSQ